MEINFYDTRFPMDHFYATVHPEIRLLTFQAQDGKLTTFGTFLAGCGEEELWGLAKLWICAIMLFFIASSSMASTSTPPS